MLPFLADMPPPSDSGFAQTCYTLAALTIFAYYAVALAQKIFPPKKHNLIEPQPLEVMEAHAYATTHDIETMRGEFETRMKAMSDSSKVFRDDMRSEQKEIGERLAVVETKQDSSKDKLDVMDAKLDRLIEKGVRHD
jgi:hypothetical protein